MIADNRDLFHVFSLDRDKNVAETIFKAIFTGRSIRLNFLSMFLVLFKAQNVQRKKSDGKTAQELQEYRQAEDKLVDLALEWNYFDGVLPILQARQNNMAKKTSNDAKV